MSIAFSVFYDLVNSCFTILQEECGKNKNQCVIKKLLRTKTDEK